MPTMPKDDKKRLNPERDEQELALAAEHLDADDSDSDAENATLAALRVVDRLFQTAPMLEAPPGFTEAVMAAISQNKMLPPARRRMLRRRFRLPWLLMMVVIGLALPLILSVGVAMLVAQGPGAQALGAVLDRAIWWLNSNARQAAGFVQAAANVASGPFLLTVLLAFTMANLLALWRLAIHINLQRQQIVYQVPVRFH